MKENEILNEVINEFLVTVDLDKDNADEAVDNYDHFCNFVDDNDQLKEYMYGFFYKLLDDYVLFRFYTTPIPALIENEDYMAEYKKSILQQARTFFDFGGLNGAKQ